MPGGIIAYLNFLNYLCRGFPFYVEIDEKNIADSFARSVSDSTRHRPFAGFRRQDADACAAARTDRSLYGNNPFEQPAEEGEEGEQQPQDTTKKERKIRKPLESYFFSDSVRSLNNFRWNVRRDYNRVEIGPLDTTLTDWRIDYPFYREEVGRHRAGRSRTGFAADELFPAAPELRLRFR